MDPVETIRMEARQDMEQARARLSMAGRVREFVRDCGALGYAVQVASERGLLVLRLDPDAPGRVVEAGADEDSADMTDKVDTADAETAAGGGMAEPVSVPAPVPAPAPKPRPKPASAPPSSRPDGPPTEAERERVLDMLAAGRPSAEIARALGLKLKQVQNLRYRYKAEIGRRQEAPAAPAPDKTPAAASDKTPPPAEIRPAPPAAALSDPSGLSQAERAIDRHLAGLGAGDGWTPARDLALVEALCRGDGCGLAAETLGIDKATAAARWQALNTRVGDLDHQRRLVRVLRLRVGMGGE